MLTENDVVKAVCERLRSRGFSIEQELTTSQRGTDIIATKPSGGRVLVEAKGATTSKPTKRRGKPFDSAQVRDHVAGAFFKAASLIAEKDTAVVVALPDTQTHRRIVNEIETALDQLKIAVWYVAENGQVLDGS